MKTKLIIAIITGIITIGIAFIKNKDYSNDNNSLENISIGDNSSLINRSDGNNIINSGNITNNK